MANAPNRHPHITVIVPVFNEQQRLPALLNELRALVLEQSAEQIIIVDGGSDDGSWQWLQQHLTLPLEICQSQRGRAWQMNAGAQAATGEVLLFLHADTQLPANALAQVREVIQHGWRWGRFDVRLGLSDDASVETGVENNLVITQAMRMVAFFINLRSRLSGVATGDQAMFFSRELFQNVGGFDELSLMEDIAMSKKCRRLSRAYCSRLRVTTSARRWEQNGVCKTILQMWWYRLSFALGLSSQRLARGYRNVR